MTTQLIMLLYMTLFIGFQIGAFCSRTKITFVQLLMICLFIKMVWEVVYNFACVCYGDKYPVEYVQKLYNMVTRNTTLHINFFVFTDHVKMHKMIDGHINIREFPETDLQGWWNKMQLFHPKVDLPGHTLYMDLDVVITDNIDCFFTYKPEY